MTDKKKNLYYLDELSDYKVASDDPDVRGWEVKDADDRVIGKVDNLLVSKRKEKVVYLDIEVDKSILSDNHKPYRKSASDDVHDFINKDGENHLILPVGLARLNEDDNYVYTDRINRQTFAETKRKKKGADVDREYETVVLESYERGRTTADTSARPRTDSTEDTGTAATGTGAAATGRETPTSGSGTGTAGTGRDVSGTGTTGSGRDTGTPTTGTDGTGRDNRDDQSGTRRTGGAGTGPDAQGVRSEQTSQPGDRDLEDRPQNRNNNVTADNNDTLGRRSTDTDNDDSFYDREEFDTKNYRQKR